MTELNQNVSVKEGPIVVNLFAGPGAGKSTTAAALFTLFKLQGGIECELITEFAKELVWEERFHTFDNQFYLFAKQQHRLWRVADKVEIAVVDSPILLSNIYGKHYNRYCANDAFYDYVLHEFNRYDNINLFIERKKAYMAYGRNESKEEAILVDKKIKAYFAEQNIPYSSIEGTVVGTMQAARMIYEVYRNKFKDLGDLIHEII